jgi:hypothetical protein
MYRFGGGLEFGKEHWVWALWAEAYVNPSLPNISIPLYRCRVELRIETRRRPIYGSEMALEVTSKPKAPSDPLKLLSRSLSSPSQVVIREPDFVSLAAVFQTPVWKRRTKELAEGRFRLAVSQLAFAEIEVIVPLESTND